MMQLHTYRVYAALELVLRLGDLRLTADLRTGLVDLELLAARTHGGGHPLDALGARKLPSTLEGRDRRQRDPVLGARSVKGPHELVVREVRVREVELD
jgi:hypothetical protein